MSDETSKKIPRIKKTYAIQVVQALLGPVAAQALQMLTYSLEKNEHHKYNGAPHVFADGPGEPRLVISRTEFAQRISIKEDTLFKKHSGAIHELCALELVYAAGTSGGRGHCLHWGVNSRRVEKFITAGLQLYALGPTAWTEWEQAHGIAWEFSYVLEHGKNMGKRFSPFPTNDPAILAPTYENLTPYRLSASDKKILSKNLKLLFKGEKPLCQMPVKGGIFPPFTEDKGGNFSTLYEDKGGNFSGRKGGKIPPFNDGIDLRTQGESDGLEYKDIKYKKDIKYNESSFSPCATLRTKNSVECSNNLYSGIEDDPDHNNDQADDQDLSNRRNSDSGHTCRKNIFYESIHIAAKAMLDEVGDDKDHKKIQSIAADLEQVFAEYYVRPDCPFADAQDFLKQWALTVRRNRSSITALEHLEVDEDQKVWGRFQQRWM